MFGKSKRGCSSEGKGDAEDAKDGDVTTKEEQRWHDKRREDRTDATESGGSSCATSTDGRGVKLWPDGIERAPCAEVEEGQEAAGEDNRPTGGGESEEDGGQRGAGKEDGKRYPASPDLDEPGGSSVAR